MVSSSAGINFFIWLTVAAAAVFLLLKLAAAYLRKLSGKLLEAQRKVPFHSGGGLVPVLLEKLSSALSLAAYLDALLWAVLILIGISR